MEPCVIALLGCGTVGSGVAKLLLEQPERLAQRAGRPLVLRRVLVRDPDKPRRFPVPRDLITSDFRRILDDPSVAVVAELVGGIDFARRAVLDSLAAGKHVVTANKALLATHGAEICAVARKHRRAVAFEAAVAGGVPIVAALAQSLAANQIQSLVGILNGTSNFILTGMTEHGLDYAEALAEAQRLGYAEADPTLDVDGTDAAQKLAILAQIAFGVSVPVESIERRGIADVEAMDIRFGLELGYVIKLVAEAWVRDRQLAIHVSPVLLRKLSPLAQVRGPNNAIHVVGDAVGECLFYGQGAGMMPTASAVVADLIDVASGRAALTFERMRYWQADGPGYSLRPSDTVRSRFYLRMLVADQPGVLAAICGVLARHQINISSVIQHEALDENEGDTVPLVIMPHTALASDFRAAVADIDRLPSVRGRSVYYPVAD
jgi:homoserine dehydrogenase